MYWGVNILIDNIKLVICDVDGTLTGFGQDLSEKAMDVINRLKAHGVQFGIASGRPLNEIRELETKWNINFKNDLLIGMNGAQLWDGNSNTTEEYFKLKCEWMKEIIETMAQFDLNPCIYYGNKMMCQREDQFVLNSIKRNYKETIYPDDISEMYKEENAKIMFRGQPEETLKAEEYMREHPSPYYHAFRTGPIIIEFADKRTCKAYALKQFCEHNNIPLECVVAFGDTSNDNDMLSISGTGVCLCNGTDDTKAIADIITEKPAEEDGFAYFVEEHILKPRGW